MKTALTIAGSDSSGGAGIQADLKVFSVLGVYGMSAVTCVTAQNTLGVKEVLELDPALVRRQVDVAAGDIEVDACKTGMLGSVAIVEVVEDCVSRNKLQPYVCDPVMVAKSGDELIKDDAVTAMRKRLFPLAAVVTPNRREAAKLAGSDPKATFTVPAAKDAARRIVGSGAKAVVIKGIEAADQAKNLVTMAIQYSDGQGRGTSPVNVLAFAPKKK